MVAHYVVSPPTAAVSAEYAILVVPSMTNFTAVLMGWKHVDRVVVVQLMIMFVSIGGRVHLATPVLVQRHIMWTKASWVQTQTAAMKSLFLVVVTNTVLVTAENANLCPQISGWKFGPLLLSKALHIVWMNLDSPGKTVWQMR